MRPLVYGNNAEVSLLESAATEAIPMGSSALHRITAIANDIGQSHPAGGALVKELFALATALVREERKPQPIETAPKEAELKLLLFCPGQGGWQTGEWIAERWTATWSWDFLTPTHWTEVPPAPDE